ncbi:MAG: IS5 family transposase [Puniceicoccales bacterium]
MLEGYLTYSEQKKGGRIPWCPVLMLKVLILQRFFDLSDTETEFQMLDRLSFLRFLGLRPDDGVPDHAAIWSFKERLGANGMLAVFELFNDQLRGQGLIASCGMIIDASFVEAPKQRNRRHENEQIKLGEVPEHIARKPRRQCQKDQDARWTQKNKQSYYGYKNHMKVDAASKFIETFTVTTPPCTTRNRSKSCCVKATARLSCGPTVPTSGRSSRRCWNASACSPTFVKEVLPCNLSTVSKSEPTRKRAECI